MCRDILADCILSRQDYALTVKSYYIGTAAKEVELSRQTIRSMERRGLICLRRDYNNRLFFKQGWKAPCPAGRAGLHYGHDRNSHRAGQIGEVQLTGKSGAGASPPSRQDDDRPAGGGFCRAQTAAAVAAHGESLP